MGGGGGGGGGCRGTRKEGSAEGALFNGIAGKLNQGENG